MELALDVLAAVKIVQGVSGVRKGESKRMVRGRGRGANCGGRNRGKTAADRRSSGELIAQPGARFGKGTDGKERGE